MDEREPDGGVRAALEAALCRDPDIEFALVFGSQLTDDARPSSDLDIAVKFTAELSAGERFQRRCALAGALQRDDAPFIDIADLDALPLPVAHDAIQGRVLCGDPQAVRDARADIEAAFADQGEAIQHRQQAVIDRIAEEGLRG